MDLPDPVTLAIPAFVILIIAEMVYARITRKAAFEVKDSATSLIMGLGSQLAGAAMNGAVIAIGFYLWQNFRLFDIGWAIWAFVVAFLLEDLAYYVFHRMAHRVRWFWASHVIHHSSQHYNLTTALRQTWTGFFSIAFAFRLPLFVIGFHPLMIAFVKGLNLVYQFWIHTEAINKCPRWFEAVFNTPSHHRVHHATNPRYLDANYAGTLIVWDKMFGTFVPELAEDPPRYGIVKNLGTFNPLKVAFHEWVGIAKDLWAAKSWRERAGYFLGPPGWSPDGSRQTSDSIKAEWRAAVDKVPAE
ncbi:MAG: sterol desaturase family protein [Sphingomonadales bacterium]|nr:sterol desaturase family protein [Sphingomonadales bacterium]